MHRVQLGEAPQLEKVNETGEFKRGTLAEGKERYRVETWGKMLWGGRRGDGTIVAGRN